MKSDSASRSTAVVAAELQILRPFFWQRGKVSVNWRTLGVTSTSATTAGPKQRLCRVHRDRNLTRALPQEHKRITSKRGREIDCLAKGPQDSGDTDSTALDVAICGAERFFPRAPFSAIKTHDHEQDAVVYSSTNLSQWATSSLFERDSRPRHAAGSKLVWARTLRPFPNLKVSHWRGPEGRQKLISNATPHRQL